jgi:hydroxymethylpyrimidine pyrophosphatase-like HAD family hydrolase
MRPLSEASKTQFSNIQHVLTDMDDTLTYRGKLSAKTYTALERLQTAGFKVIPVTAKCFASHLASPRLIC